MLQATLDPRAVVTVMALLIVAVAIYLLVRLIGAWRGREAIGQAVSLADDAPPTGDSMPRRSALRTSPIRILFLAANPVDTDPLRLGAEVRAIDRSLRSAEHRDRFELEQQWAVRADDLQELLLRYQPDIVHFSGHGSEANEILLEDDSGESRPVTAHALGDLFELLKDNIHCVVLNACYSQIQSAAIAQSIDCVIGMADAISDEAAIDFSCAFYRALGYGRSIQTAFDLGVNQISVDGGDEADIPILIDLRERAAAVQFV